VRQKIHFFCVDIPQSHACFVKAYPRETTEAFLDGHVSAFAFFEGVPLSILYDNLKIAAGSMTRTASDTMPSGTAGGTLQILLAHHLKQLKLPTVLREYEKVARECADSGVDHPRYLLRLIELELIDRERRTVERRMRAARFPAVKSFDTFDFTAIPSLNKMLVLELARCKYILRRDNIIALGNSGTGKTHVALALGLAACQKGFTVTFTTAASLVSQLLEARDERRLLKLQRDLASVKLLIIDELGYVPLSSTGAELLFETFSQRYERGSTIVTSNLPFEDWTSVLGSERLTGALLDRLTHHVSILTMNGDSYRLKQSAARRRIASSGAEQNQAIQTVDPDTGEILTLDRNQRRRQGNGPDRGHFHVGNTVLPLVWFYSAAPACFCSAVDITVSLRCVGSTGGVWVCRTSPKTRRDGCGRRSVMPCRRTPRESGNPSRCRASSHRPYFRPTAFISLTAGSSSRNSGSTIAPTASK
jgi:DNA replication protein DnaC